MVKSFTDILGCQTATLWWDGYKERLTISGLRALLIFWAVKPYLPDGMSTRKDLPFQGKELY